LSERLHLFGIRHHGPGSAHALLRGLDAVDPALVLIEGPPEGEEILHAAASADLVPPVALLCYAPDDPALAVFDPFAEYSPEWQAIRWALSRGRPVRFIDLPAGVTLALRRTVPEAPEADAPAEAEAAAPKEQELLAHDPLGALAAAAGQPDGETWWNGTVEQAMGRHGYFAAVEQAMSALREGEAGLTRREAMREAQMRLAVAAALSETDGPVAAVVGAWHVPALRRKVAQKDDRALLKGAERIKVATAWVPWTDTRLAAGSGYGAGVISPGWYRHLWEAYAAASGEQGPEVRALVVGWITKAVTLLRQEGLAASTASAIEAVRLAEALAAIRNIPVPGLQEMNDAILSAICHGNDAPMRLIARRLVVGEAVGEVGEGLPQTPLQADLTRQQRALRLKPATTEEETSVDLRTEAGLAKSTLFHRLALLGVPWGRLVGSGKSRGTFREHWVLQWTPELSVALAEASVHGGTVAEAAATKAATAIAAESSPGPLAWLVQSCLHADLPSAYDAALVRLQAVAAAGGTAEALVGTVPPLADILRYGTARRFNEESLRRLVVSLCAEIHINLPYACRTLDEAASTGMRQALSRYAAAVATLDDDEVAAGWVSTLDALADDGTIAPGIRGFATRQLHGGQEGEATARRLSRALSPSVPAAEAGAWIEGFLADGADILLVDMSLLAVVDAWMTGLPPDTFVELLPLIRRSLSGFDGHQRRAVREAVARGCRANDVILSREPSPIFAEAVPLLMTIIGLKPQETAA